MSLKEQKNITMCYRNIKIFLKARLACKYPADKNEELGLENTKFSCSLNETANSESILTDSRKKTVTYKIINSCSFLDRSCF